MNTIQWAEEAVFDRSVNRVLCHRQSTCGSYRVTRMSLSSGNETEEEFAVCFKDGTAWAPIETDHKQGGFHIKYYPNVDSACQALFRYHTNKAGKTIDPIPMPTFPENPASGKDTGKKRAYNRSTSKKPKENVPMSTAEVTQTFKVTRKAIADMLTELGMLGAHKKDDNWIKEKVLDLPMLIDQNSDILENLETDESRETLQGLLTALDNDSEIVLLSEPSAKKPIKSEEPEEVESEEEEPEEKPVRKPAQSRKEQVADPRPVKRIPRKEEVSDDTVAHDYEVKELEKPKLVKISSKLAQTWKDMERFPRDRDLQKARCAFLREAILSGKFRGAEWASVHVKETGKTYRINGKHSSHVIAEIYESGKGDLDFPILVRQYECPTMEDAAYLFQTFDDKRSARSKQDYLKVMSQANDNLSGLSPRMLNVLTSGIAYSRWEKSYRRHSIEEQEALLVQHHVFAKWAAGLMEDASTSKHLLRMSVVAAMLQTHEVDSEAAEEFWTKIRDDSDDPKNAPTRVLMRWLLQAKVGAGEGERKSEREVYVICLQAWNAWRNNEDKFAVPKYKEDSSTPVAK